MRVFCIAKVEALLIMFCMAFGEDISGQIVRGKIQTVTSNQLGSVFGTRADCFFWGRGLLKYLFMLNAQPGQWCPENTTRRRST